MRIALFGDAGSTNVRAWATGLRDAGADVHIVSFAPSSEASVPVELLAAGRRRGKTRYLTGVSEARRVVGRLGPDIVIGYYVTGYGITARLTGHRPLIQVPVGNDVLVNPPGRPLHAVARANLRAADLVVAWAPHLAEAASNFGVERGRIMVQPRGIDLSIFTPRRRPASGSDRKALISTRALDPYYRQDVLIEAVAQLRDDRVSLTLLGDGPAKPDLQRLAWRLGVSDKVHFTDSHTPEKLAALLASHGTYVSACPTDGVSASLLEAMAVGLFPVVVDNPANREWITSGSNGLLTRSDARSFAAAVRRAWTELGNGCVGANQRLVEARADLRKSSAVFVDVFARLVEEVPRSCQGPARLSHE
jgi:glycosyltransferase involved in cell wall biosynthesis